MMPFRNERHTGASTLFCNFLALARDLVEESEPGPADAIPAADAKSNVDIFVEGYEKEVRGKVDQGVNQPIGVIFKTRDLYFVLRRNQALDKRVAQEYAMLKQVDKGPRPHSTDCKSPLAYDEGSVLRTLTTGLTYLRQPRSEARSGSHLSEAIISQQMFGLERLEK
ncbi:hypothetical protein GGR54DRAFT_638882 [Hypoxylon sp. NC1633]|nr:hypothetical protein GGR54DRAFT_638882 [Hypoxylon sp. NC1633]